MVTGGGIYACTEPFQATVLPPRIPGAAQEGAAVSFALGFIAGVAATLLGAVALIFWVGSGPRAIICTACAREIAQCECMGGVR